MNGGHDYGFGFFGGGFMWIFWIAVIVLVLWAVRGMVSGGASFTEKEKSALDILKERYAKGEIDHEEFTKKRNDLGG